MTTRATRSGGSGTEETMDTSPAPPSQQPPPLAHHDSRFLDLAFAMDTTGSMSSYIRSACDNIRRIVEDIVAKERSDLRLALVEYRDHPPQDSSYVTQVHDFTPSVGTMKSWLQASSASGGGDAPEAVADALHDVLKLAWRPEATKICVLVSDAPPHGLQPSGDGFPNGCPAGHDPMDLARKLAEKGVTLYVAGCEPALITYKDFFAALAHVTGGQYVPLSAAGALTAVIVGGAQEELSLEQWMDQVNHMVVQEVQQQGEANVDYDALSHQVMNRLGAAGARTKQLQRNNAALEEASDDIVGMSACPDMASMRAAWKPRASPQHAFAISSLGAAGAPPPPPSGAFRSAKRRSAPKMSAMRAEAPLALDRNSIPPPAMGCVGSAEEGGPPMPVNDYYDTGEGEIQMAQAKRMVQKSLMRNNISLGKK